MSSLSPPSSSDPRAEVDAAVRSVFEIALPEVVPPPDDVLYTGLDDKMTAYMKARLAENPLAVRTFMTAAKMRAQAARQPRADPEWIYFIQSGTGGLIKIGCAVDVEARRTSLQTGSADRLTLLAAMPGGISDEHQLHAQFADARIHGEWFAPTRELLEYIRENAS